MTDFRAARPHGPIREVLDGVYVVTGEHGFGPFQMTRNMTLLRRGGELTVFNSVRLCDDGERELLKLGAVKNLVRLGFFHGIDDPYYMARFQPRFFSPPRMDPVNVEGAVELAEGEAPFGTVHRFQGAWDEACIVVDDALITCDSLQNNVDTSGMNLLGGAMGRVFGLVGGVRVGPPWARRMTGGQPAELRGDFERLLAMPFRHLLSAHGQPCLGDAREKVTAAVARAMGGPG